MKKSKSNTHQNKIVKKEIDRRQFIKKACLYTAGAVGTIGSLASGQQPIVSGSSVPGKMTYRRLGRTGLDISVVVAGEMDFIPMHERAYELGVNYWHKVGNFEHPGPEFFKGKDRDSIYCDMVIDTLDKDGAIAQFEWGLKQSGLEMIDFMKVHSLYRDPKDVKKYSGIFKAFDSLKKQGKTRFLSVAQHYMTAEILAACIESGLFDAIQPNFNVFSHPEMFDLIGLAEKQDVGVICKKVLAGGARNWQRNPGRKRQVEGEFQKSQLTLGQALLKWALDIPGVTAVVPLITNFEHLEEDIAVGFDTMAFSRFGAQSYKSTLKDFADDGSRDYCRSCGQCESVCPQNIAVADIFRYELYFSGYGNTERARKLYGEIPVDQNALQCDSCSACEAACPNKIPIVFKLQQAHSILA